MGNIINLIIYFGIGPFLTLIIHACAQKKDTKYCIAWFWFFVLMIMICMAAPSLIVNGIDLSGPEGLGVGLSLIFGSYFLIEFILCLGLCIIIDKKTKDKKDNENILIEAGINNSIDNNEIENKTEVK